MSRIRVLFYLRVNKNCDDVFKIALKKYTIIDLLLKLN